VVFKNGCKIFGPFGSKKNITIRQSPSQDVKQHATDRIRQNAWTVDTPIRQGLKALQIVQFGCV
jgi:hypothetical protein